MTGTMVGFQAIEHRPPSPQTAVDVFAGKWSTDLSCVLPVENTGAADLFIGDPRPRWAAEAFGKGTGRLDGLRVLELGPLEGAHSYQLEKLGAAKVVSIDNDTEAYLKCLTVKEILGLKRCEFRLGDAAEYMRTTAERFDIVFCSGLLYHVMDPIDLIKHCCEMANRCFIWTHYYNADGEHPAGRVARAASLDGFDATYHVLNHADGVADGVAEERPVEQGTDGAWMERDAIFACFKRFGLSDIRVFEDAPSHANGSAMSFTASRPWAESFVRLTPPP